MSTSPVTAPSAAPAALVPTSPLTPIAPQERVEVIDVLRGFALIGIFLMHVETLRDMSPFGHVVTQALYLFCDGKFRALYSFLFGLGFSIQLLRAQERGVAFAPVYLRRSFVLLLIGLAHYVFLWPEDILRLYAIMSPLLLVLHRCRLRTLVILAVFSLMFETFVDGAYLRVLARYRPGPDAVVEQTARDDGLPSNEDWTRRVEELNGPYSEMVRDRVVHLKELVQRRSWYFTGMEFCMFLLGLYAGRRGVFHDVCAHLPFIRRLMWWGLAVGLTLNVADVVRAEYLRLYGIVWPDSIRGLLYNFGRPAMSLFYASALVLLALRERGRRFLRPLSWTGRMALTNYLLQSFVGTMLLYGYGFGLLPHSSAITRVLVVVAFYPLQLLASRWWMARYRFGPAEWMWRSAAYGKWQPMRVR